MGLATLGAIAALALGVPQAYAGPPFSPFTIAPGNMDCIQVHDPTVGWTGDCDPVNVLFPRQTLASVVARLRALGWSVTSGSTEWMYFGSARLVPVQAQLGMADGADPTMRYHVRLWQAAPDLVVGAVHHEHGTPHRIDLDWDAAERFLAAPMCATRCRHMELPGQASLENGSGRWRGWANDAIATVIPPAAKAPLAPA